MGLRLPMGMTRAKLVFAGIFCFEYDRIHCELQGLEAFQLASINYFSAVNHMTSDDLTREQIDAIWEKLSPFSKYVKALLKRMVVLRWSKDDGIRQPMEKIDDGLGRLWISLHYLKCKGQTASFSEKETTVTTEQLVREILAAAIEHNFAALSEHREEPNLHEITTEELAPLIAIADRWLEKR